MSHIVSITTKIKDPVANHQIGAIGDYLANARTKFETTTDADNDDRCRPFAAVVRPCQYREMQYIRVDSERQPTDCTANELTVILNGKLGFVDDLAIIIP